MNTYTYAYAISMTLVAAAGILRAAESPWPNPIQSNITDAITATRRSIELTKRAIELASGSPDIQQRFRQSSLFAEAIDRLGKSVDEKTASAAADEATIESKLIVLAYHRARRREDFDEIEKTYVDVSEFVRQHKKTSYFLPRFISPGLDEKHCQEKYRLPWEYLLLRPLGTNALDLYDYRARDAIACIKNEKSLVTLEYNFAITAGTPVGPAFRLPQDLALGAMNAFRTEKGLQTLLRCVGLAQGQPKEVKGSTEEWDVEKRVQELLTSATNPEHREQWKTVVQAYSRGANVLPEKQRQFLQRVNETLARHRNP